MKSKTLGLFSIIALALCLRVPAQTNATNNAIAPLGQNESRAQTSETERVLLTRIPLLGDEAPFASLLAAPRDYLGQPVVICGAVNVANYYNYGYEDAQKTHFCLDVVERTKDDKPTG